MKYIKTDFIVVGTGIAGLMTALFLSKSGDVVILTKAKERASNSFRAQGGIAAAVGKDDSPDLHRLDTLRTGLGLCDPEAVEVLVKKSSSTIRLLMNLGTEFDHDGDHFALGREAYHSVPRILHVAGDSTGAGISSSLLKQVSSNSNIELVQHTMVVDLIIHKGVCHGVIALNEDNKHMQYLAKKGVVLATGGCGQVYRNTTNDLVSTGDGFAIAYRGGAALIDMEFVQFHPTALAVEQNPMFLISEAVRGEGATLINEHGEAFMEHYHGSKDLAPRDVASRAIYNEIENGHKVFLDTQGIGTRFSERFPMIYKHCLLHGVNPPQDLIPVVPAAHFIMGGVKTDLNGQTSISRLFACGEVACTGVHGANRLASNSLLEGIVFAERVANYLAALPDHSTELSDSHFCQSLCKNDQSEELWKQKIREIMWNYAGIVRSSDGLLKGILLLNQLKEDLPKNLIECHNMLVTSQMIIEGALWRQESRGGHYRCDFPKVSVEWSKKHHVI